MHIRYAALLLMSWKTDELRPLDLFVFMLLLWKPVVILICFFFFLNTDKKKVYVFVKWSIRFVYTNHVTWNYVWSILKKLVYRHLCFSSSSSCGSFSLRFPVFLLLRFCTFFVQPPSSLCSSSGSAMLAKLFNETSSKIKKRVLFPIW